MTWQLGLLNQNKNKAAR